MLTALGRNQVTPQTAHLRGKLEQVTAYSTHRPGLRYEHKGPALSREITFLWSGPLVLRFEELALALRSCHLFWAGGQTWWLYKCWANEKRYNCIYRLCTGRIFFLKKNLFLLENKYLILCNSLFATVGRKCVGGLSDINLMLLFSTKCY